MEGWESPLKAIVDNACDKQMDWKDTLYEVAKESYAKGLHMKFKAEDGSEWEYNGFDSSCNKVLIERSPEKSELDRFIESLNYCDIPLSPLGAKDTFTRVGFKKAIEVGEKSCRFGNDWAVIKALKTFAGIK